MICIQYFYVTVFLKLEHYPTVLTVPPFFLPFPLLPPSLSPSPLPIFLFSSLPAVISMATTESICNGHEPSMKRQRLNSDPDTLSTDPLEDYELAALDRAEEEEEMSFSPTQPTTISPSPPSVLSQPPREKWKRPPPPKISPTSDPLIFQQIDIDHYIGGVVAGMPGAQRGPVPILRMFGVTAEGNSICAHIHGFLPYFFVPAPLNFRPEHCKTFREQLNKAILSDPRSNRDSLQEPVLAVEMCLKSSVYGFYFNEKSHFLKITVALPKLIAPARRLISDIDVPPIGQIQYQVLMTLT